MNTAKKKQLSAKQRRLENQRLAQQYVARHVPRIDIGEALRHARAKLAGVGK